jgi:hypothetical protein
MFGYFDSDHLEDLAGAALLWTPKAMGVYVTMNPVNPDLLGRAANRIIRATKSTKSTSDADIVGRRRLTLDFDPERPAGVSATDEEKVLASQVALIVHADLSSLGWPAPMTADSGNGYHLNYVVDLPTDDGGLTERFLGALSAKYTTPEVKVDASLFNPSRIIKLYGTWSRKGDSIPIRPHRLAQVTSAPKDTDLQGVDRALIEEFVKKNPLPVQEVKPTKSKPASRMLIKGEKPTRDLRVGDNFEARAEWCEILTPHSWSIDKELDNGEIRWTRPGKNGGTSATTGHNKGLHVFTDSREAAPFEAGGNYTKFEAYTRLNHGGCHKDAVRALVQLGYGRLEDTDGQVKQNPPPPVLKVETGDLSPAEQVTGDSNKEGKQRQADSQASVLLALASSAQLFHAPDQRCFARIDVGDHREVYALRSAEFRRWIIRAFYLKEKKPPSSEAIQTAIATLEAMATFDGSEEPVFVRVAPASDGSIFIDLGNASWNAVKVSADGWEIVADPPVRFIRTKGMRPLPSPERGGSLELLKKRVNIGDQDWMLLVAWLTQALRPTGPYPVLTLAGEQGSSKSTTARIARMHIDPHVTMLRSEPRENRDLMIGACNGWVIALDNVSHLAGWLSDGLCRLATGGGFATRSLYSDSEETYLDATRPIVIASIEDVVRRGDLADRCITITLAPIPESKRRTEAAVWSDVETDSPRIMGALLDAVAGGLRKLPNVRLSKLPRMADFAKWGEAVCQGLGKQPEEFLGAYADNRQQANESVLDDSSVAHWIRKLVATASMWNGTSRELLDKLTELAGEKIIKSNSWPKSPRAMSGTLRRLAPSLRMIGITVEFGERTNRSRPISIGVAEIERIQPSPPSPPLPTSDSSGQIGDGQKLGRHPTFTQPSPVSFGKTRDADGGDGADGGIPPLSGDAVGRLREVSEI